MPATLVVENDKIVGDVDDVSTTSNSSSSGDSLDKFSSDRTSVADGGAAEWYGSTEDCERRTLVKVEDGDGVDDASSPEYRWSPSGSFWRDLRYFAGPGWFVCVAYVDPGNYQADMSAGAASGYRLLWTVWWSSALSVYVQVLCVRLAVYGQTTLAEAQARHCASRAARWTAWAVAELSVVITDLPEVVGVGIACRIFFGWPYWVGVVGSLFSTMSFLAVMSCGTRVMETILAVFVGVMSVALFTEMTLTGFDAEELWRGWTTGFTEVRRSDLFQITGILGSVVMPHNLYLHTAACRTRRVVREEAVLRRAVKLSSLEAALPIFFAFFINAAIVSIAAESARADDGVADDGKEYVGLTTFCRYFRTVRGGCFLYGVALLAAGQSSAITTTFTGQGVMDGFLRLRLPTTARALVTRLLAVVPPVLLSLTYPDGRELDRMVDTVNSSLSFLLSFALTPLALYTTDPVYMGRFVPPPWERRVVRALAAGVFLLNAVFLAVPGGGMFGFVFEDLRANAGWAVVGVVVEVFYVGWHVHTVACTRTRPMDPPYHKERRDDENHAYDVDAKPLLRGACARERTT